MQIINCPVFKANHKQSKDASLQDITELQYMFILHVFLSCILWYPPLPGICWGFLKKLLFFSRAGFSGPCTFLLSTAAASLLWFWDSLDVVSPCGWTTLSPLFSRACYRKSGKLKNVSACIRLILSCIIFMIPPLWKTSHQCLLIIVICWYSFFLLWVDASTDKNSFSSNDFSFNSPSDVVHVTLGAWSWSDALSVML